MATYRTPGVYVEEISTLPPSVAEVSTAVPAFFGYTEKGSGVARISTLLEFEELFGKAKPSEFTVTTRPEDPGKPDGNRVIDSIVQKGNPAANPQLAYAVSLYFKNGGGSCYIVSVGNYDTQPDVGHFTAGLASLEREDEPTLIVLTDAVLLNSADYYATCQAALAQCNKLGDRFTILDVKDGDVDTFRGSSGIGANNLMYGAAYHPYLQSSLAYHYDEAGVTVEAGGVIQAPQEQTWTVSLGSGSATASFTGAAGLTPNVQVVAGDSQADVVFTVNKEIRELTITNSDGRTGTDIASAWATWAANNDAGGYNIQVDGEGSAAVDTLGGNVTPLAAEQVVENNDVTLASLVAGATPETQLYNQIKVALAAQRVVLPPSAAIAGVYAQTDRDRGVWKAPANVGVSSIIGPVSKITHTEQEGLNVDPNAGKSINAIRAFAGKGTLVWGARTLAGNDNEWRYVSVRRLFITIEESTQKATAFAVFEPNDTTTWLKVKGMIESYLYGLWERGALAGSTPDAAYFVNVGLGKTMTTQDVLEGRMIVEIGVAAVRPAEFIILRFTHKLQEA